MSYATAVGDTTKAYFVFLEQQEKWSAQGPRFLIALISASELFTG